MGVNMLPWIRLLACLCVVAATTPAQAAWRLVEGIDVASGGAATLLIGDLDQRTALYARCVAGKPELFVDSFDGSDAVPEPVGDVVLTVATDAGPAWSSPARYGREKSGYITTTWLTGETIGSVVAAIVAAKSSISISIDFQEVGATIWDTDAKGSTAAGRKFLEACPAGAAPATSPTPAAVPEPSGAWTVNVSPDAVNGGETLVLIGDLDQGGYFFAFCNGRKEPGLFFVSNNPGTFPYEVGDVGITLRVEIDGEERSATGEVMEQPNGNRAILYTAHEYVPALLSAVAAAKAEVAMTIHSYASGVTTRWPAKNLEGLAEGMARFNAHCFGDSTRVGPPAEVVVPVPVPAGKPWVVTARPEADGTTSYTLVGEAVDGRGALIFACVAEGGIYLGFTAGTRDLPPLQQGQPMQLNIRFGTFSYGLDADVRATNAQATTVFSNDAAMASLVAEVLSGGQVSAITTTVRDAATGSELVRQVSVENAGPAATEFRQNCEAAQTAEATPSAPTGSWLAYPGADFPQYDADAVMVSTPNDDGVFAVITCAASGEKWSLYLVTAQGTAFPFGPGDYEVVLTFRSGDAMWEFPTSMYWQSARSHGVVAWNAPGSVIEIIGILSLGSANISVELADAASGRRFTYDLPTQDADTVAVATFGACF
jgi:hypothetical protein